jgi:hypothetical protein
MTRRLPPLRGALVYAGRRPARQNIPCPSKRGPRFDGAMRRPVAAVEARRSRPRAWLMTVAVMEGWLGKRGAESVKVPSKESYMGSHRGESESWTGRKPQVVIRAALPGIWRQADRSSGFENANSRHRCPWCPRLMLSSVRSDGSFSRSMRLPRSFREPLRLI